MSPAADENKGRGGHSSPGGGWTGSLVRKRQRCGSQLVWFRHIVFSLD